MEAFTNTLGNEVFIRMKMNITRKLGPDEDTENNFRCKWSDLMDALDEALGEDTGVKCLSA